MTTALTEGVTPDGQSLSVRGLTATVKQYGGFITLSDLLMLTAVDNNLLETTKLIASQAGRTMDTITKEVLNAGTVVQYAGGQVSSRSALAGGSATASENHYLTGDAVKRAGRYLESQDAPRINGSYVGIIHPYCKYDLMKDPDWKSPHQYVDTSHIYANEIGELYGVRFVQSSRAKKWHGENLASNSRNLAVNHTDGYTGATTVAFDGGTVAEHALKGRPLLIGTTLVLCSDNTANSITIDTTAAGYAHSVTCGDDTVIYPGEGGAAGADVFSTLILGDHAYGVTEISGGGLEHIAKQLGSGGSTDPLNQRASVGWKATRAAEILVPQYIVRIESTATP